MIAFILSVCFICVRNYPHVHICALIRKVNALQRYFIYVLLPGMSGGGSNQWVKSYGANVSILKIKKLKKIKKSKTKNLEFQKIKKR